MFFLKVDAYTCAIKYILSKFFVLHRINVEYITLLIMCGEKSRVVNSVDRNGVCPKVYLSFI